MVSHSSQALGHGDSILMVLLMVGAAIGVALLVGALICLFVGAMAWRAAKKDSPEIAEFKPLGLVSFLTLGFPLFGLWPYLLLNHKRLKSDPELWAVLRVPLGLYALSLVGGSLWACLAHTAVVGEIGSGLAMLVSVVNSILLFAGGRNSADSRFREVAKYSLRVLLSGVVMGAMFALQLLGKGHGGALPFVLCISVLVSTAAGGCCLYSWVRKNLALLLVTTRSMPEARSGKTTLHLTVVYLALFAISSGVLFCAHAFS